MNTLHKEAPQDAARTDVYQGLAYHTAVQLLALLRTASVTHAAVDVWGMPADCTAVL